VHALCRFWLLRLGLFLLLFLLLSRLTSSTTQASLHLRSPSRNSSILAPRIALQLIDLVSLRRSVELPLLCSRRTALLLVAATTAFFERFKTAVLTRERRVALGMGERRRVRREAKRRGRKSAERRAIRRKSVSVRREVKMGGRNDRSAAAATLHPPTLTDKAARHSRPRRVRRWMVVRYSGERGGMPWRDLRTVGVWERVIVGGVGRRRRFGRRTELRALGGSGRSVSRPGRLLLLVVDAVGCCSEYRRGQLFLTTIKHPLPCTLPPARTRRRDSRVTGTGRMMGGCSC